MRPSIPVSGPDISSALPMNNMMSDEKKFTRRTLLLLKNTDCGCTRIGSIRRQAVIMLPALKRNLGGCRFQGGRKVKGVVMRRPITQLRIHINRE